MEYEHILYEVKRPHVAWITLNRPEVDNATTGDTFIEMAHAFNTADDDTSIGVVVLTGAGDSHFNEGGQVKQHLTKRPGTHRIHFKKLLSCATAIRNCGKPVIAAVNGRAIGSGNQLQLLCDLAISSDQAVFGQHGSKRAGVPMFWGSTLMSMFVGERKAREIIFLSREYSAEQALEMGLVNEVVPHDQLYVETDKWCDEILEMSPTSMRVLKTSMNMKSDMLYPALFHAREIIDLFSDAPERMEGTSAWVEGRKPDFNKFRK
ncbi:MAG: 1,4-dihydroxy-6-naphthoate synthase [Rhodospirillales bacterium]|jgi:naphthoate synthase/2-ketocyclohexanecarboxyl-CoA hydrolase|nr:1,4-dihydroxy-6-naphthoate synthase [Rhodospirillales bacterium]